MQCNKSSTALRKGLATELSTTPTSKWSHPQFGPGGDLAHIVFGYLLTADEAYVFLELMPNNKLLQALCQGVSRGAAIIAAGRTGWVDGLRLLIDDVHTVSGQSQVHAVYDALCAAASHNHIDAMRFILDYVGIVGSQPLELAAQGGHIAAMWILKRNATSYDIERATISAVKHGQLPALEFLIGLDGLRDETIESAVEWAILHEHLAVLNRLFKLECLRIDSFDSNEDFRQRVMLLGLHLAAERGKSACVRLMLDFGAIPTVDTFYGAGFGGDMKIIQMISQVGEIESDEIDELDSLLAGGAAQGHIDVIRYAISRGAVNMSEALDLAIESEYFAAARVIMDAIIAGGILTREEVLNDIPDNLADGVEKFRATLSDGT